MGTNFYMNDRKRDHIGKRSGAGEYCWDCHLTLCRGGEAMIHVGDRRPFLAFFLSCPKCGKKPRRERLEDSTAGRELGFNTSKPRRKKGVSTCCSFSWAMNEDELARRLSRSRKAKPIIDEYGEEFTAEEFGAILSECPVRYVHSIGVEFS